MHARILGPETGIWRTRYEANYDMPEGKSTEELGYEYQTRAIVLSHKMDFRGTKPNQKQQLWLDVIYTMLAEALTTSLKPSGPKTYNRLREVMAQEKFLSHPRKPKPCQFICTVQLVSRDRYQDAEIIMTDI